MRSNRSSAGHSDGESAINGISGDRQAEACISGDALSSKVSSCFRVQMAAVVFCAAVSAKKQNKQKKTNWSTINNGWMEVVSSAMRQTVTLSFIEALVSFTFFPHCVLVFWLFNLSGYARPYAALAPSGCTYFFH